MTPFEISEDTIKVINDHLTMRELEPVHSEVGEPGQFWRFKLSGDLESELTCHEQSDKDITVVLSTAVVIEPNDDVVMFASAVAPVLAPATIICNDSSLQLRFVLMGGHKALPSLLDEGVMLSRHILGTVFVPAVALSKGEITAEQAMKQVMEVLQKNMEEAAKMQEQAANDGESMPPPETPPGQPSP